MPFHYEPHESLDHFVQLCPVGRVYIVKDLDHVMISNRTMQSFIIHWKDHDIN